MKCIVIGFAVMLMLGCGKDSRKEQAIGAMPVSCTVQRFDREFAQATPDDLPHLKKAYPYLFPAQFPDSAWVATMRDSFQREALAEIQKTFPNFESAQTALCSLFRHVMYYFPGFQPPQVVTVPSGIDYTARVIYADSVLLVSLDMYLGEGHRFYREMPGYLRKNCASGQMVVDVAAEIARRKTPYPNERTFLSQLVYYGKMLYLLDVWLPDKTDAEKMGYTDAEYAWARANESEIWRYWVGRNLLFSTDARLLERFIDVAPFSKFYLELDVESPGMLGRYMGWQMVRAYMKNKDVSLQGLLDTPAEVVFREAKFKPRK